MMILETRMNIVIYIYLFIYLERSIESYGGCKRGQAIWVSKIGHDEMAHQWATYATFSYQAGNRKTQKENGWFQTLRLLMFYPTSADDPT